MPLRRPKPRTRALTTPTDGPEAGHPDDLADDADDDETASLRPLFPDGDPSREGEWRELWPDA